MILTIDLKAFDFYSLFRIASFKIGQGHQNLISLLFYTDTMYIVYLESIALFKNLKFQTAGVTLKIKPMIPEPNQLFPLPPPNNLALQVW